MYCDFAAVTDILLTHMIRSSIDNYKGLLETLFSAYLKNVNKVFFDNQESSKYATRVRIPPADFVDYYFVNNESSLLMGDISYILTFVMDKEHLHSILFKLLLKDGLLSVAYRKRLAKNKKPEFSTDEELTQLIYECVRISLERPYFKGKGEKEYAVKSYFNPDSPLERDNMFSNSKIISPCPHFTGYDTYIDSLNTMFESDSKLFVTGMPGIGKSELVRAYIKKYKSSYANIGYYIYGGSLRSIIANMNNEVSSMLDMDTDDLYQTNLEVLKSLDDKSLIVIDNFNVGIEEDNCLNDLLNLKCRVIITSHMKYDDVTAFTLKGMSKADGLKLVSKFYEFTPLEGFWLEGIISMLDRNPLFIEMIAKMLKKGGCTAEELSNNIMSGNLAAITQNVSVKKDTDLLKDTFYGIISKMFGLFELSEQHRNVMCMMLSATENYVRKDTAARLFGLKGVQLIDDLIDSGLIMESEQGMIMMSNIVCNVVYCDLKPDKYNCSTLIENIRAVSHDERLQEYFGDIRDFVATIAGLTFIKPFNEAFDFDYDCFKYLQRLHDWDKMEQVRSSAFFFSDKKDKKQWAILDLEDAAIAFETRQHEKALELHKKALDIIMELDDERLKVEAISSYAYYLDCSRIGDNVIAAPEYYKKAIELYEQLDLDEGGQVEKCRVIARYAYLLLLTDHTDEAFAQAEKSYEILSVLNKRRTTAYETYADTLYVRGLCLLLKMNDKAKFDLSLALHIYLKWYRRESDFIESKLEWIFNFALDVNSDIMETKPLKEYFDADDK